MDPATVIEAGMGLVSILGSVGLIKSARSGILRNLYVAARDIPEVHSAVRDIPEMKETVEEIESDQEELQATQEDIKDAAIALAETRDSDDKEVNAELFRKNFADNHSSKYTEGDD